ncbi:MAG: hypothetical protein QM534_13005, partial [Sediminibacterium sp.]|nr:hypothetical protein [Sediminibacterium sp.]
MKNIILIFLMVWFGNMMFAQTSCQTAQPFCVGGASSITFPATTNGPAAQAGPFYDCLLTQPNPAWYYIQISTAGTLSLTIQGQIGSGPGQDVDFVCWGPFPSLANICNSLTATNVVDCSYSSSFTETLTAPGAQVGQYYMVCITNFANVTQNIVFGTLPGNTAQSNCGLLSTTNHTICAGSSFSIVTNAGNGLTNVSYSVQPGGQTSPTPTIIVTPSVNTSYTIFASGLNSVNAPVTNTAIANFTVYQTPQPAVVSLTQATCTNPTPNAQLNLSSFPPTPAANYSLTFNPAPVTSTLNGGVCVLTPSVGTTNYTISIQPGGCKTTGSFVVNPIPQPVSFTIANTSQSNSITCSNPTVTLVNTTTYTFGTLNYLWTSTSFTSSSGTVNLTQPMTLTCVAIDPATTCSATNIFAV